MENLILDDMGKSIGEEHQEFHSSVWHLFQDPKSVISSFLKLINLKQARRSLYISNWQHIHECAIGWEVCYYPQMAINQEKMGCDDDPVVLSTNNDVMVGVDPSLRYLFVIKNIKKLVKVSSRQYYHDTKFSWKKGKQQWSYKRHQERLDYFNNKLFPNTNDLEDLQS